jgi:hypothetical protein
MSVVLLSVFEQFDSWAAATAWRNKDCSCGCDTEMLAYLLDSRQKSWSTPHSQAAADAVQRALSSPSSRTTRGFTATSVTLPC